MNTLQSRLDDARERAIKTLDGFEFNRLVESESVEAWRCKKSGTGFYSHDIVITTRGIAVVGDVDGLLFNVGSDYGMKFLAGDDVSYYIHSKLEEQCKDVEFNADGFLSLIVQELIRKTSDQIDELSAFVDSLDSPSTWRDAHKTIDGGMSHQIRGVEGFLEVESAIRTLRAAANEKALPGPGGAADSAVREASGKFQRFADDLLGFMEEARVACHENSIEEALTFLREKDGTWVDLSDGVGRIDRPSANLLFVLSLVNQSAKRIVAIKEQERFSQSDLIVEGFERELLKGDGKMGGGDALALYDMPETVQEGFAAGWNRRSELNRVYAAVPAPQFAADRPIDASTPAERQRG